MMVAKVSSIFFDKWSLASNMLLELLWSERYPSSNSATFKWMTPIFKVASEMAILASCISNDTVSSINGGNASQMRTNAGNTFVANSVRHEVGIAKKKMKEKELYRVSQKLRNKKIFYSNGVPKCWYLL